MDIPGHTELPVDIWHLIFEYLSFSHVQSLASLALVDRGLNRISRSYIHESISFAVIGRERLAENTKTCSSILERSGSLSRVRRLDISGCGPYKHEENVEHSRPGWRFAPGEDFGESLYQIRGERSFSREARAGKVLKIERPPKESWQPLIKFIRSLPKLTDLFWNCDSRLPPQIIPTLHRVLPHCRIWLNKFFMADLGRGVFNADELNIMTSPSLHAISASCNLAVAMQGELPLQRHDYDVIMLTLSGLAPKLKKVNFKHHCPTGPTPVGGITNYIHNRPTPPWNDSIPIDWQQARDARDDESTLDAFILESWAADIDMAEMHQRGRLCRLTALRVPSTESITPPLTCEHLSNLVELAITLSISFSRLGTDPWDIECFLLSLPALSCLRLDGAVHLFPLERTIHHHGSRLKRLYLMPSIDLWSSPEPDFSKSYLPNEALIPALAASCPHLTDLAISLHRTMGNHVEVASYRALGMIKRLKSLELTLDCSDYTILGPQMAFDARYQSDDAPPSEPDFDQDDQEICPVDFSDAGCHVRNGHVRHAFMNAAMDESLARSIFDCISSNTTSNTASLERLQIRMSRQLRFYPDCRHVPADAQEVLRDVSHDWILERSCRDDSTHVISAKDITTGMTFDQWYSEEIQDQSSFLVRSIGQIVQRLWPHIKQSGSWQGQCHSFPLDLS